MRLSTSFRSLLSTPGESRNMQCSSSANFQQRSSPRRKLGNGSQSRALQLCSTYTQLRRAFLLMCLRVCCNTTVLDRKFYPHDTISVCIFFPWHRQWFASFQNVVQLASVRVTVQFRAVLQKAYCHAAFNFC